MEDKIKPGFSVTKGIAETKSSKNEESMTEISLGKRKSSEEDHHTYKRSGDSFAAPLPFSKILKRKRAVASGGSSKNKDQIPQVTISKEEAGDKTQLITEEKTEVISESNPTHEAELEEGTIMKEGEEVIGEEEEQVYEENEEEQAYVGDELNGEFYYEEGYEEDGEYTYEEGENAEGEEVEKGEEATEGAYIASQRLVYGAPAPNPFGVHDPFASSNGTPTPQQPAVNNPFGAYQPTYQPQQHHS